jgi:hypothetical protein
MSNSINASAISHVPVEKFLTAENFVSFPWLSEELEIIWERGWVVKVNYGEFLPHAGTFETAATCSPDGFLKTTHLTPLSMEEVNELLERVKGMIAENGACPYVYVDNDHHWTTDGGVFFQCGFPLGMMKPVRTIPRVFPRFGSYVSKMLWRLTPRYSRREH